MKQLHHDKTQSGFLMTFVSDFGQILRKAGKGSEIILKEQHHSDIERVKKRGLLSLLSLRLAVFLCSPPRH